MRVVIDILDLNEFDPIFEETKYVFNSPTMQLGQIIGTVKVCRGLRVTSAKSDRSNLQFSNVEVGLHTTRNTFHITN